MSEPIELDSTQAFYRHAELYAIVARRNHEPGRAWFFLACWEKFGTGDLRRGVELCCGPALLSFDLIQQGLSMTAVDLSPEMLEEARRECEERSMPVTLLQGDMRVFRASPAQDFVLNFGFNTGYLLSNEAMTEHLHAVADSLRPGGLYLVEMDFVAHRYLHSIQRVEPPWIVYDSRPVHVSKAKKDGIRITISFGGSEVWYDPVRQLVRSVHTILLESEAGSRTLEQPSLLKLYHPLEFQSLVQASGRFEWMGWYTEYRLSCPLEGRPEANGYVVVLRRR